jgi:hypothetical protein
MVCLFLFKNNNGQNLIQNNSFEIYDSIDCGGGGFDNYSMIGNPHVIDNWYGYFTPDYFNAVCNPGGFNVPNSYFGYSNAKTGNAFIGIGLYEKNNDKKEYIYQQLLQPLQAGKIYCLSFFVTRIERTEYAIKQIGAYFSTSLPNLVSSMYINAAPQIVNQNGFITDTTQWIEIQGCFTSTGGEQYIVIGNFNTNTNTDTLNLGTNNPIPSWSPTAYYYIDDITLIDQTTVGVNELDKENSFEIYPNPNNGLMQFNYSITKKAEFVITDITGRTISSYILDEAQKNTTIKETALNAGIYFYSVRQNNVILKLDKFVIIK